MKSIQDKPADGATIQVAGNAAAEPTPVCHIIVGDSSPQTGGMCAHMTLLADGLANAAQDVHVWAPDATELACQSVVKIHKTLGKLSLRDLRRTGGLLNGFRKPRRLLVYWVPHAYGYKSMNVLFCLWLWLRSAFRKDRVELMVQECFLSFSRRNWKQSVMAMVHRMMIALALNAADHVWIALSGYEQTLRPWTFGKRVAFTWLPVPSNVEVHNDPAKVADLRARLAATGYLIGHFGTYGDSITRLLDDIVPALLKDGDASLLLLGSRGLQFRKQLLERFPDFEGRLHATGYLSDAELSIYLSACDVMIQPYPDGLTGRRGSSLAPLAHGCAIVTNATEVTESLWSARGAVIFAEMTGPAFREAVRDLRKDPAAAQRVRRAAHETYVSYFDPAHMVKTIQAAKS